MDAYLKQHAHIILTVARQPDCHAHYSANVKAKTYVIAHTQQSSSYQMMKVVNLMENDSSWSKMIIFKINFTVFMLFICTFVIGAALFPIFGVRFILFILIAKTAVLFCYSCLDNETSVYSS